MPRRWGTRPHRHPGIPAGGECLYQRRPGGRTPGLAQATISQHLRELKELGLIQGTVEGVSVCYCINPDRWAEVKELFGGLFDRYQPGNFCC